MAPVVEYTVQSVPVALTGFKIPGVFGCNALDDTTYGRLIRKALLPPDNVDNQQRKHSRKLLEIFSAKQ